MGAKEIEWSVRAKTQYLSIVRWYLDERGFVFAQKFVEGIDRTVELLAKMPTIGILDEKFSKERRKLYTFPSHHRFRIEYRYDKKKLYIVGIRTMNMNN